MNEIFVVIQASSAIALFKIAVDLGKILQQVKYHDERIKSLEDRIY